MGLIKVAPLLHIDIDWHPSRPIARCVVVLCCRYMHALRLGGKDVERDGVDDQSSADVV